eukprot:TRINITY_DN8929_c0_g1_i1.p1 TRINITY_DN8929_c0_g1~~TRINITY_DN8929_c0_g1_i1.p1  ORF type:complete len:158 (+),score=21.49 TRINITY_DN8929_c0_g1_i1:159-632(+)
MVTRSHEYAVRVNGNFLFGDFDLHGEPLRIYDGTFFTVNIIHGPGEVSSFSGTFGQKDLITRRGPPACQYYEVILRYVGGTHAAWKQDIKIKVMNTHAHHPTAQWVILPKSGNSSTSGAGPDEHSTSPPSPSPAALVEVPEYVLMLSDDIDEGTLQA